MGYVLLAAGALLAQGPPPDPKFAALANQIFEAPDAAARTALLESHRDQAVPALAATMNEMAGQVYDRRDFSTARKMYQTACEVAAKTGGRAEMATCTYDLGLAESRLQLLDEAREHMEASLPMYREVGDRHGEVTVLNAIGVLMRNSGDNRGSLIYFRLALELSGKVDEVQVAQTNTNMSNSLLRMGNHQAAIECLQKALAITQRRGMMRESGMVLNNLSSAYFHAGDMEVAANYAAEALAIKEKSSAPSEIASSVLNLGVVQQRVGKVAEARQSYERAMQLTAEPSMLPLRLLVQLNYGNLLYSQGEMAGAKELLTRTVEMAEKFSDASIAANARVRLARITADDRQFEEAVALAGQAAEYGRWSGEVQTLTEALDVQGVALLELQRYHEGEAALEEAIQAVEETRAQLPGEQQGLVYFMEEHRRIYLHMSNLQLRQGHTEAALAYVERSKARSLLDTLKLGNPSITSEMTAEESSRERALTRNMESIRDALLRLSKSPNRDRKKIDDLTAQLDRARAEYRAFETSLYVAHPRLKVQRAAFDPVASRDLIAAVPDPAAALLEYSLNDAGVHLFVITRAEGLKVYHLEKKPAELRRDVARFRQQIAGRDLEYRALSESLYGDLLEPAAAQLKGKTSLVIAPDGFLWDLPFQALSPAPGRSLLEDCALAYTPSLTLLYEIRKLHDKSPSVPRVLALNALDVPAAKREVEAMRQVYGAPQLLVLSGEAASVEAFKREAGRFDVLHVAAHGVFDNRSPLDSYLTLAEDTLEAREVMDLNLHARMVVLSGCETGRGEASGGEGLLGMSWALFIAGSPATVASQWKVDSDSTSRLMLEFHRNARREGKARALRHAALTLMKNPEWRHPFYWSSFVVIGEGF